ncbi:exodeoxyribonuclease VII large subunit [bacterium]|nr:MAG: exodeoxyribonuclease VII large subunit [bacterium]
MNGTGLPVLGVAEVARYVRALIEDDERLRRVIVRGEISNFRGVHANGNAYFDVKDDQALLNCVMWGSNGLKLPHDFANGMQIDAEGRLSTYPRRSTYQLIVDVARAVGQGDLHARYEELRERLQREGLFALERKRPLPRYPQRIAVVTSPAAAAYQDFLRTMGVHAAHVALVLVETPVQGREAAFGIAAALDRASALGVDAIALIRGGGSFEDLFAFNEEPVVRAIVRASVPVVTGIGHESDVTLADFAADLREPTPTAAARAIAPSRKELLGRVERLRGRLLRARSGIIEERRQRLDYAMADLVAGARAAVGQRRGALAACETRLAQRSPQARLAAVHGRLLTTRRLLMALGPRITAGDTHRLGTLMARLAALDPSAVLQRGYAIVTHEGRVVREAASVPLGALVEARLARGTLAARVERGEHG